MVSTSGSNVILKWSVYGVLKLLPGATRTCLSSSSCIAIVEFGREAFIELYEGIHCAHGWLQAQVGAQGNAVDDDLPLLVQASARLYQFFDALETPERGLHRPLPRNVGAQPECRQQLHAVYIILRTIEAALAETNLEQRSQWLSAAMAWMQEHADPRLQRVPGASPCGRPHHSGCSGL